MIFFIGAKGAAPNWIVVDIVKVEGGILTEHWDVIQDETTRKDSKSGNPMFGDHFPDDPLNF